ncbi:MAG: DUF3576 domain-containing protein [Mangrovicoccus sp.]
MALGPERLSLHRVFVLGVSACLLILAGCSDSREPGTFDPKTGDEIDPNGTSIWDLFENHDDPNVTLEVNRYLWTASLEILSFMPLQSADPFSGIQIYGYGTPPGGRTAYRATVLVQDPSLEARSLNVSLATHSGPASPDTIRAVEDAILTRARQMRIADESR